LRSHGAAPDEAMPAVLAHGEFLSLPSVARERGATFGRA
jgi:hypothetical protein